MRRPAAVVLGTVLGSALLVGARLGSHAVSTETVVVGAPGDTVPTDGEAGSAIATTAPSARATTSPAPRSSSTKGSSEPSHEDTAPATEPAPQDGGDLKSGTFAGVPVTHKYGTLQVTITISGGRISGIVESYKTSIQTSKKINAEALPQLRQEALVAQSADINTISGATYTSDAYRASLQSALDKAKG